MSGIYIPGMNLPKDCPMCPMSHWNAGGSFSGCEIVAGKKYAMDDEDYRNSNERPDWCPIIEIPPHGRLIEADALIVDLMDRGVEGVQTDDLHEVQQTIMDADTIIPADRRNNR